MVVTVDAENVFDDVAGALHIHTIGRNAEFHAFLVCFDDFHFQRFDDATHQTAVKFLADEFVCIVITQIHGERSGQRAGTDFAHRRNEVTTGHFHDECGSAVQGINLSDGVNAAFEAEGRVGGDAVTASGLAHPSRVEVGAFQHHFCGFFRHAGVQTAHDACHADRSFRVADEQVFAVKFLFCAIENDEGCAFGHGRHTQTVAAQTSTVEAVERLTVCPKNIVRHIDHGVQRSESDGGQSLLEPLGAFADFATAQCDGAVARTSFGFLHRHFGSFVFRGFE